MDAVLGLVGALVGALVSLLGTHLGQANERKRWREEVVQRNNEWLRDQLLKTYSDSIYYLTELANSSQDENPSNKEVRQFFSESLRHLYLLRAYHINTDKVDLLEEQIKSLIQNKETPYKSAINACGNVQKLLQVDKRLNISVRNI